MQVGAFKLECSKTKAGLGRGRPDPGRLPSSRKPGGSNGRPRTVAPTRRTRNMTQMFVAGERAQESPSRRCTTRVLGPRLRATKHIARERKTPGTGQGRAGQDGILPPSLAVTTARCSCRVTSLTPESRALQCSKPEQNGSFLNILDLVWYPSKDPSCYGLDYCKDNSEPEGTPRRARRPTGLVETEHHVQLPSSRKKMNLWTGTVISMVAIRLFSTSTWI